MYSKEEGHSQISAPVERFQEQLPSYKKGSYKEGSFKKGVTF
jgi:hypothetical protein